MHAASSCDGEKRSSAGFCFRRRWARTKYVELRSVISTHIHHLKIFICAGKPTYLPSNEAIASGQRTRESVVWYCTVWNRTRSRIWYSSCIIKNSKKNPSRVKNYNIIPAVQYHTIHSRLTVGPHGCRLRASYVLNNRIKQDSSHNRLLTIQG